MIAAACLAVATPATMAGLPVNQLQGRGAAVPFTEYEAESACYHGTLIGPSRKLYSMAAEASNRRAVRLQAPDDYVEFTLAKDADALTVRYAIPDSPDGQGMDATLGVFVNGERIGSIPLTSRYGWFYGRYPFTNRPADGGAHHMFDEGRLLLGKVLPAGTRVRLILDHEHRTPWAVVDVADFELVGPSRARPPGSLDAQRFGADPSGKRESSAEFARAIAAARHKGRPLWVGPGTYRIERHLAVDGVTMTGAGPWHTVLSGRGVGLYGHAGAPMHLSHFAIIGDVRERNDQAKLAGVGGTPGRGSSLSDLWLQHLKSGVWFDGPSRNLTIRNLRILDNSADGINLRRGVTSSRIENVFVRNSGDDGIALWSHHQADRDVVIARNSVVAPILANGIAVYGGRDIRLQGNVVADTLTEGGGIHLGNRFDAVPLAGSIRLEDNLLVRTGSFDPHWRFGVGALWLYALDAPIRAKIQISRAEIRDSTIEAVQLIGKPISGVVLNDVAVDGAAVWLQLQSRGEASFTGLTLSGIDDSGVARCSAGFVLHGATEANAASDWCAPPAAAVERRLSR